MLPQYVVWGHSMQVFRTIALAAIVGVAVAGGASARTLASTDAPAELPPASFKGTQYVDSNGCVFVRAGYNGAVNWVPRVTRDKRVVCGYKPTFPAGTAGAAPAARPAPEIVVAAPRPAPVPEAVGKPMETVAVKVTPPKIKAAPAPVVPAPVAVEPAPVAVAPKPLPKPTPRQIEYARQTACPQFDRVAQDHMILVNGYPVRCGPQAEPPHDAVVARQVVVAGGGAGGVAPVVPVVPKGYKVAWADGRLNPQRGPVSASGDIEMAQVFEPGAVPMVPRDAKAARVVAQAGGGDGGTAALPPKFSVATKGDPKLSAAPEARKAAPLAGAWVQVGSFGVPANAAASAARLKAAGLPVAMGRGGKGLQVVLAGPFASQQALQAALAVARGAGFRDAFVRK